jgi:uncharacterized membrane protein
VRGRQPAAPVDADPVARGILLLDEAASHVENRSTNAMSSEHLIEYIRTAVEWAALGIELLGVVVIVAGVLRVAITRGTVRFLLVLDQPGAYDSYKHQIGRSLLLGLEFLVAGDVVRTVALEPTLANVAVLGLLVLVRTFLSWSLAVEIDGRWPWQPRKGGPAPGPDAPSDEGRPTVG